MSANHAPLISTDLRQGVVPREITQAKLDRRAAASARIKPRDLYTLADRLEEKAASQGERPFLIHGAQRFSYAEVDARANQVAHAAFARGLRSGDVCALAMENRPEFFFIWFGLVKLGVVVAFINTQVSGKALVHALDTTRAKAVVVGDECLANFTITDGLPAVPLWRLADPAQPWQFTKIEQGLISVLELLKFIHHEHAEHGERDQHRKFETLLVGLAEVRDVFKSPKFGAIAGCMVTEGTIKRHNPIRVLRDNVVIYEGELESLRRFKDDVREVKEGFECGIKLKNYNDIKEGDQLEFFEVKEVARTLS